MERVAKGEGSVLRSDAPLIRHLAESFSPATARQWQRPPLVLLPGQGFVEHLLEQEEKLSEDMPRIEQLPWEDVVFDYQNGRRVITDMVISQLLGTGPPREAASSLLDRGVCWIRVRSLVRYREHVARGSPWMRGPRDVLDPFAGESERWLAVEAWEQNVLLPGSGHTGFPAYPDVSLVPRDRPWDWAATAHLYPNLGCRSGRAFGDGHGFCNLARCKFPGAKDRLALPCHSSELIMSAGVRLALLTLAYLLHAEEHLVEVDPVAWPAPRKGQRSGDQKPWTRALPHVILLDPRRAGEYGQPEERMAGGGEESEKRASPRAHQRRGHWRRLASERFREQRRVWVRQAWIGPREWVSEGQRYRLLEPAASRVRDEARAAD